MDSEIKKSTIFDDILYLELIPWLDKNKPDEIFADKISQIKTVNPDFPTRYKIVFHRSFNKKTTFYEKLILNKSIAFCNEIFQSIHKEDDKRILKYFKLNILERDIPDKLKELGKVLAEKQYSLDYINPRITTFNLDKDHKTETFIMQLLKVALMWCYLEIQSFFSFIPPEEIFIEEDFYTRFLFEPVPVEPFIKELPAVIKVEEKFLQEKVQPYISEYSFTYKDYHKSPDKITYLFQALKDMYFIAQNTSSANFKKIFSGKKITTPVVWTGLPSDLFYFISLIHTKHQLIKYLKQKQWEVTCKCFIKEDGSQFEKSKFRSYKKPMQTFEKIERAVNNLK